MSGVVLSILNVGGALARSYAALLGVGTLIELSASSPTLLLLPGVAVTADGVVAVVESKEVRLLYSPPPI